MMLQYGIEDINIIKIDFETFVNTFGGVKITPLY